MMLQVRRQYAESWRRMVELRAQIQAQLRLAHTLKRLAEHAGQVSTSHNTVLVTTALQRATTWISSWTWLETWHCSGRIWPK